MHIVFYSSFVVRRSSFVAGHILLSPLNLRHINEPSSLFLAF